jgi:hypothetical protein
VSDTKRLVFISYRRADTGFAAQYVASILKERYGPLNVFVDTEQVQGGDDMRAKVDQALDKAGVVVSLIGPMWLGIEDATGGRRLDGEEDWIRYELGVASARSLPVVPVLVSGAEFPALEQLPVALRALGWKKAIGLSEETAASDMDRLIVRVDELTNTAGARPDHPLPTDIYNLGLSEKALESELQSLPEWRIVRRSLSRGRARVRTELFREYRFLNYADAIHFIVTASR